MAASPPVVETALKAANLVGDGLYGVDPKQTERGVEDRVLGDALDEGRLLDFVRRVEAR